MSRSMYEEFLIWCREFDMSLQSTAADQPAVGSIPDLGNWLDYLKSEPSDFGDSFILHQQRQIGLLREMHSGDEETYWTETARLFKFFSGVREYISQQIDEADEGLDTLVIGERRISLDLAQRAKSYCKLAQQTIYQQFDIYTLLVDWLEEQEGRRESFVIEDYDEAEAITIPAHLLQIFSLTNIVENDKQKVVIAEHHIEQVQKLRARYQDGEDFWQKMSYLYRYFCNLHNYVKTQIDEEHQEQGDVFTTGEELERAYKPVLDSFDEDSVEDVITMGKYIPRGVAEKVRAYCESAAGAIYKQFPPGNVAFFPTQRPVSRQDQHGFRDRLYHHSSDHFESQVSVSRLVTMSSTPTRPRIASLSRLPEEKHSTQLDAQDHPVVATKPALTFCQKWSMLSGWKKFAFIALITTLVAGAIAAGVVVPGAHVITLPSAGVISAKLLAIFVGAALVAGTAVGGAVAISSINSDHERAGDMPMTARSKATLFGGHQVYDMNQSYSTELDASFENA
jgi:hypothetical protein